MAEKIELEQIENGPSLIQTLSVGTGMGQLNITNGNTVHLGSISLSNKQDANTHPKNSGGLEAFSYNAPSAINYPVVTGAGGGGGISFYRNNSAGGLLSSFDIVKAEHSEEKLRFRVGISTTAKGGWKTFASEEYVNDVMAGLGLDDFGGRNLIIQNRLQIGYIVAQTGVATAIGPDQHDPNYYECSEGDDFVSKTHDLGEPPRGGAGYIAFYDDLKVFISSNVIVNNTVGAVIKVKAPTNAKYYRYAVTSKTIKVKLEKGNTPTDWTPAPEDQVSDWNETDSTKYSFIKNKPNTFTPSAHTHPISDVIGLQNALNGKANTSGNYQGLTVGNSTRWNTEQFDGTNPATTASYFMVSNGSKTWNYISNSAVRNSLGIPTASDYITTNTNQTGLSGDKTSSGIWTLGQVRKAGQNDTQILLAGGGHRPVSDFALISQVYTQAQALALFVGKTGVETIQDTKTFTHSPVVPNGTLAGHTVNLGQMQSYVTGLGYQNASQVNTIVNNAVSAIPPPGNGSVVIQGIGSLTGTATFSMNQSNNVVGSFDLTASTKADISEGKEAGKRLGDLFGGLSLYPRYHDVSSGLGTVDPNEAFFNLVNPRSTANITVEIINHSVHGARLVLQGVISGSSITYTGRFIDRNHNNVNSVLLEANSKEYYFDAEFERWREVF